MMDGSSASRILSFLALLLGFPMALVEAEAQWSSPDERLWPDAAEIEHFLEEADITEREKIGTGVTNPEKVTLELDGEVRYAVFKRVDKEYDSWRAEVAAYELDKLLGLGMVPPTVERRFRGRKGCLQLWVTGETMKSYEGTLPDMENWRTQVSVMWLFDDLIANIDRHLNNAMVSPDHRLMLIDNSKTFRYQRTLLNKLNGPGTGTHARFWRVEYDADRESYPTSYPLPLVKRLRELTDKEIKNSIKRYIHGRNRDLVIDRREIILKRLTAMPVVRDLRPSPFQPLPPERLAPRPAAAR